MIRAAPPPKQGLEIEENTPPCFWKKWEGGGEGGLSAQEQNTELFQTIRTFVTIL